MKTAKIGFYFPQFKETVKDTQYVYEYEYRESDGPLSTLYNTFAHIIFQSMWVLYTMQDWEQIGGKAMLVVNGIVAGMYQCELELKPSFSVSKIVK